MQKFVLQKGKTHRIRLVNVGADGIQRFAIDGHRMTVISNDFVPVVPYEVDVISLGVGQRTDILVTADSNSSDAFWMRSYFNWPPCGIAHQPFALAGVYYSNTSTAKLPQSQPSSTLNVNSTICANVSPKTTCRISS
jgi:FtsP/CotA-like multicopper oxidase with cupredoxin domain